MLPTISNSATQPERSNGMICSRRKGLWPALRQAKGEVFKVTTPARREKCLFGQFQVCASAPAFPLENEVILGIPRQADPKVHCGVADLRFDEGSDPRLCARFNLR